jgi:hypothetical protein
MPVPLLGLMRGDSSDTASNLAQATVHTLADGGVAAHEDRERSDAGADVDGNAGAGGVVGVPNKTAAGSKKKKKGNKKKAGSASEEDARGQALEPRRSLDPPCFPCPLHRSLASSTPSSHPAPPCPTLLPIA